MRKDNVWMGAAFWVAVAVLMPMAALEPTGAHAAARTAAPVEGGCEAGQTQLVLGCDSIYL